MKIDGFWLLSREEAVSAVKIFGDERLSIDYQNYTVNGRETLQPFRENMARGVDR